MDYKVLTQDDLQKIFPFGKSKLGMLLRSGAIPVVKVGRTYLINEKELDLWFERNKGREIFY